MWTKHIAWAIITSMENTTPTPLLKARQEKGWTQKQAASKAGIEQGHYSRIERGLYRCNPDLAARIVAAFKGSGLDEIHVLYPERFMPKQRRKS